MCATGKHAESIIVPSMPKTIESRTVTFASDTALLTVGTILEKGKRKLQYDYFSRWGKQRRISKVK